MIYGVCVSLVVPVPVSGSLSDRRGAAHRAGARQTPHAARYPLSAAAA